MEFLNKILDKVLGKLDGRKTAIGLLGLSVTWLIRQWWPDLIDADTANKLWLTFGGIAGFGIGHRAIKQSVKANG
jgi:hypothetical protein